MKHLNEELFEQDNWTYLIIEQKEHVNFFNNGYFSPNDYYKDDIDDNKFLLVNTNKNINSSSGQEFVKNQWKRKFGTSPQSMRCILSSNGSIDHAKYIKKIAKAVDLGKVTLKDVINMCAEWDGHWENKVPYVYGKIFYGNIKENKNIIKDMKRNNDRMLLESLVRKYGKNSVVKAINELKSETYHSAYRKADQLGRKKQAAKFLGAFNKTKDAELKTALHNSLGELIEEVIINSPDILLTEVISSRLGDTIGFVFQGSKGIYAPIYDDDTDLDEMITIVDELGYYEGDFEFGSIDDILNEIKGTLSMQDARKLSRKLSQLYGTTGNQFDWHQFAEL